MFKRSPCMVGPPSAQDTPSRQSLGAQGMTPGVGHELFGDSLQGNHGLLIVIVEYNLSKNSPELGIEPYSFPRHARFSLFAGFSMFRYPRIGGLHWSLLRVHGGRPEDYIKPTDSAPSSKLTIH